MKIKKPCRGRSISNGRAVAQQNQTDTSVVSRLHMASEPLRPDHPHSWTLDVTTLTPEESAKKILVHTEVVYLRSLSLEAAKMKSMDPRQES
jgi:hypothetical protein